MCLFSTLRPHASPRKRPNEVLHLLRHDDYSVGGTVVHGSSDKSIQFSIINSNI
jgi:hypothetical protein